MRKSSAIVEIKNYSFITLGIALAAFGIAGFLMPNKLAPGGVSGVATVLHYMLGIPVGSLTLAINIPLFIIAFFALGRSIGIKSIYATLLYGGLIDLFGKMDVLTDDLILASIFGGLMLGLGFGLVFIADATSGGTDIVAKLIQKVIPFAGIGKILLVVDILIIGFATLVFRDIYIALYSLIALYVNTFIIDAIIEGIDFAKIVFIISNKPKDICDAIMTKMNHGVTGLYGRGAYSNENKEVLLCTLKRTEIVTLKSLVRALDPEAFVVVTDAREVVGKGFKEYK